MESHILNTYHHARYRTIGHKILRSTSDSLSSESSGTQNSPEYTNQRPEFGEYENNGDYWRKSQDWSRNQTINMTRSQDTSSDEDENIEVQEVSFDERACDNLHLSEPDVAEENTLVEGDDYDVIQVYAVDPDLDLEASSDEEHEDNAIKDEEDVESEYLTVPDHSDVYDQGNKTPDVLFNLDAPVVSNVDEYFIKEDKDKDILAVKDEPVVKDVDEYFIKEDKVIQNVDDFFIKKPKNEIVPKAAVDKYFVARTPKVKDVQDMPDVPEMPIVPKPAADKYFVASTPKAKYVQDVPDIPEVQIAPKAAADKYFVASTPKAKYVQDVPDVPEVQIASKATAEKYFVASSPKVKDVEDVPDVPEMPINESDLEILPNIEELKRFLLGDMTYTKFKSAQRSCSLPQSPMHNICLDIDDAKTCLSFEDLNLDLSDLTFDNEKDKTINSTKSDDIPRTLTDEDVNSFLITSKPETKINDDDLSHQDMEMDCPVENTVLDFCVAKTSHEEKPVIKKHSIIEKPVTEKLSFKEKPFTNEKIIIESPIIKKTSTEKSFKKEIKVKVEEDEDVVDVESCNDTVIPVLEANNLSSLLEQFEATEKLNTKPKRLVVKPIEEPKVKSVSLTNGMRLQDAGVQLNKNKMRKILMPSTINAAARRSPSPVYSDHDYCSSKKRYSLPNIKGGQSLLKPEVLSSNSKILSSRHRSCKNKKIVYNLSSDDEADKCNSKNKKILTTDDSDIKKKLSVNKQTVKVITNPTRKKLSPVHSENDTFKDKSNSSVIVKDACKASDSPCSQNPVSIKLTIKNKSEVILNCDDKDSQKDKDKNIEKFKSSLSDKDKPNDKIKVEPNITKIKHVKSIKELDSNQKSVSENRTNVVVKEDPRPKAEQDSNKKSVSENRTNVVVKEEPRPKAEHFYTALFSNKQDVQVPHLIQVKTEKRSFEEEISIVTQIPPKSEVDQPIKKKKLNLQEYKLRRCASSNNSSAQVSPEAIFPDMPVPFNIDKIPKSIPNQILTNGTSNTTEQTVEEPKKLFDPIREASRKILMNTKKHKAEAMRKRDEDIVMSKIPKVENLELQPLISDAEMMKIVGMAPEVVADVLPAPIVNEKPQLSAEYEEIVMVSIGTNTDETVFKELEKVVRKKKSPSPVDSKSLINFKIKKSDHVLKQNVFDAMKRDKKSPVDDKKSDRKIDKARYKDITATLKSVGKQVDTKMSSNSLFASIQDVVMKKAPDEDSQTSEREEKRSKSKSPKHQTFAPIKTTIVRDYDNKVQHGEDKIILHLGKDRNKPDLSSIVIQTDSTPEFKELPILNPVSIETPKQKSTSYRKRNDSDMSMSSEGSPVRLKPTPKEDKVAKKSERRDLKRSESNEKRPRSKERYEKYRRSRSRSRSRRRRHSRSRSRTRSRGRFRRYRRSDSPYRRKRRSRTRSPYRSRRSPSIRREYRSKRSRSRHTDPIRSPVAKKKSPPRNGVDRKSPIPKSMTPPPRKPTVSESSDTSTSSSSSSSSSSSEESQKSTRSGDSFRREEFRAKEHRSPYSSEDRESNTPVEERRIVFVGKLEKDITKSGLRSQFTKFGPIIEVRLHSKEDGTRYGFVTYQRARDAWTAVEAASTFPQYDVGFGGRRAFCRQSYADLDGLEAKYTESAFHGQVAPPARRHEDMSFEQMLLEMKKKLSQRKNDPKREDEPNA